MNGDERDARHALVAWLLCFLTVGLLGFGLHQQHLMSLEKIRIEAARLALIEENKKVRWATPSSLSLSFILSLSHPSFRPPTSAKHTSLM